MSIYYFYLHQVIVFLPTNVVHIDVIYQLQFIGVGCNIWPIYSCVVEESISSRIWRVEIVMHSSSRLGCSVILEVAVAKCVVTISMKSIIRATEFNSASYLSLVVS